MSLKKDITAIHPEQKALIELFEKAGYRHNYYDVFSTLLDYLMHEYTAPADPLSKSDFKFPNSYDETEQAYFKTMLWEIQNLCFNRCRLWSGQNGWYDPFGCLFESVGSHFSKQAAGQFFTPETICNMMAKMTIQEPTAENIGQTMCDPCSGSGRLILAASNINPSLYCVGNDIDRLCAKMTALNMCLNGAIGEVSCNDGLWATEANFRFAFKVVPLISLFNDSVSKILFLNPMFKKQYCLLPLEYQNCKIQQAEPQQKEFFTHQIETQVQFRKEIHPEGIQGVLFEAETIVKAKRGKNINREEKPKLSTEQKLNLLLNI